MVVNLSGLNPWCSSTNIYRLNIIEHENLEREWLQCNNWKHFVGSLAVLMGVMEPRFNIWGKMLSFGDFWNNRYKGKDSTSLILYKKSARISSDRIDLKICFPIKGKDGTNSKVVGLLKVEEWTILCEIIVTEKC